MVAKLALKSATTTLTVFRLNVINFSHCCPFRQHPPNGNTRTTVPIPAKPQAISPVATLQLPLHWSGVSPWEFFINIFQKDTITLFYSKRLVQFVGHSSKVS